METLHITLFGSIRVAHPAVKTQIKLARGTQALLAYLLLRPHPVERDVLVDVFWGEQAPDQARSNLNTAVWRLRQVLEPDGVKPQTYLISTSTGEVGFNWDSHHWLDVKTFEQRICPLLRRPITALEAAHIAQMEECLILYRGDLLESLYTDWALAERERFRSLHLNCLARLMEYHASQRNFEQSIAFGQEILRRDPLREEVHRGLMRIYLDSGQRPLALRQYQGCCELLDRELGVPPLEETQALYQQIVGASQVEGRAHASSVAIPDLALLVHELQRAQQSIDEAVRTLAQIQAAISQFTNLL